MLGASGLVGQASLELFEKRGIVVIAPSRQDFEVRQNETTISSILLDEMNKYPIIDVLHSDEWHSENETKIQKNYIAEIASRLGTIKREKPYVYFSSGALYGSNSSMITSDSPINVMNSYAEYKLMMENVCRTKFDNHKIFRLFFPYGQLQGKNRLIPQMIGKIQNRLPISCNQDGGPSLSIIDVRDVAQILFEELLTPWIGTKNIAGGEIIKIKDLADILGESIGVEPIFEINLEYQKSYIAAPYDKRLWRQISVERNF